VANLDSNRSKEINSLDLAVDEEHDPIQKFHLPIRKLLEKKNNLQIKQSTEHTRSDKPGNLMPHDKDHAGDHMSFVPIFHSESNQIEIFQQRGERHLKKRNESSKQRDEDHHASNHNSIILDEHKNPRSNLYLIRRQRRFPGGMMHGGAHDSFRLNN
jgi:hypothetical protein